MSRRVDRLLEAKAALDRAAWASTVSDKRWNDAHRSQYQDNKALFIVEQLQEAETNLRSALIGFKVELSRESQKAG